MPPASEHDWLNSAIYEELVHGHVLDRTRRRVVELIHQLWDAGAEGVLLGCTELELLIHQADVDLPGLPVHHPARRGGLDRLLTAALWRSTRRPAVAAPASATRRRSAVRCCSGTVARSPQRSKA